MIPPTPEEDIARMRVAGRIAREVLDLAVESVKVGMTTDEIDAIGEFFPPSPLTALKRRMFVKRSFHCMQYIKRRSNGMLIHRH